MNGNGSVFWFPSKGIVTSSEPAHETGNDLFGWVLFIFVVRLCASNANQQGQLKNNIHVTVFDINSTQSIIISMP